MASGGVGGRVAEERRLAGLTQHQLGTRANVSTSLVRAVEQGRLAATGPAPSASSTGARHDIQDRLRTGDEAALSMWGQLHLKSGLATARAGDRDTADGHLAEARDMAVRVSPRPG